MAPKKKRVSSTTRAGSPGTPPIPKKAKRKQKRAATGGAPEGQEGA